MLDNFVAFLATKPTALSVHFVATAVAFGCGLFLYAAAKGTPRHRTIGRVFVAAILVAALTGFFIYEIFGHVSPFHLLSVFTLITVLGGVRAIRKATPQERAERAGGAMSAHINRMSWCFAALIIAALVEALRLLPAPHQPAVLFGLSGDDLTIASATALSLAFWLGITGYTLRVRFRRAKSATHFSRGVPMAAKGTRSSPT